LKFEFIREGRMPELQMAWYGLHIAIDLVFVQDK